MESLAMQEFFELSRAEYLTVPRSILEAMPYAWQQSFASLLNLMDETFDWRPRNGECYHVDLVRYRNINKYTVEDPLQEYRHPDRFHIEQIRFCHEPFPPFSEEI